MDDLPQCELDDTTLGAYVHSPHASIEALYKHCGVNDQSVVLDLGCGDGRSCLVAASKFGARAYGVDIDADLVTKFKAKVESVGLSDKVTAICGDACIAHDLPQLVDVAPTHVYVYILMHMLHLLIPTLQRFQDRNPAVTIMTAFAFPAPNVPSEVPAFDGALQYKIYRARLLETEPSSAL
jgi:SAM-dependent methyltransferase